MNMKCISLAAILALVSTAALAQGNALDLGVAEETGIGRIEIDLLDAADLPQHDHGDVEVVDDMGIG